MLWAFEDFFKGRGQKTYYYFKKRTVKILFCSRNVKKTQYFTCLRALFTRDILAHNIVRQNVLSEQALWRQKPNLNFSCRYQCNKPCKIVIRQLEPFGLHKNFASFWTFEIPEIAGLFCIVQLTQKKSQFCRVIMQSAIKFKTKLLFETSFTDQR